MGFLVKSLCLGVFSALNLWKNQSAHKNLVNFIQFSQCFPEVVNFSQFSQFLVKLSQF